MNKPKFTLEDYVAISSAEGVIDSLNLGNKQYYLNKLEKVKEKILTLMSVPSK